MPKPSQVVLLVEDSRHQQFICRYLRRLGLGLHAMRIEKSPSGAGSAEQWVRERFAIEVDAYRRRQAQTKLIVLIDADRRTVQERLLQLDQALREAGTPPIANRQDQIARLVPKRNIETWILCLNAEVVNENTDYKAARDNWTELIRAGVETLHVWTRPRTQLPQSCVQSLQFGVWELQNAGL